MTDRPPLPNADLLRAVIGNMNQRKEREAAELAGLIRGGGVPVSDEVLERLSLLQNEYTEVAFCQHPGHAISEAIESYSSTFDVLATATDELVALVDAFDERVQSGEYFSPYDQEGLSRLQRSVQKESLLRRQRPMPWLTMRAGSKSYARLPNYDEKRAIAFGADGLHDLIIGLRTILHHAVAIKAGWHVVTYSRTEPKKADFRLKRATLTRLFEETDALSKGQKENIASFLAKAKDDIELRDLFPAYLARAVVFRDWLIPVATSRFESEISDLQRCHRELRKSARRTWWNMLIGNWATNFHIPPNPYNHLWKYLKADQLSELEAFQMGSTAQIDRIIEIVDEDGACDGPLRALIYKYFEKAVTVHGIPASIPRAAPDQ